MKKKSVEKVIQDRITNALNVGITKEYNTENRRKLWDDSEAKEAAKQKKLNGKKTYEDPVSGKTLHKYNYADNAVKRKYGEDKWIDHGMETDHIIALKEGHRRYKYNPFLSNEDFKKIMNMPANHRVISKRINTQMGEMDDIKYLMGKNSSSVMTPKGKAIFAGQKIGAEIAVNTAVVGKSAENAAILYASGAFENMKSEETIAYLMTESIRNIVMVANEQKSKDDAINDLKSSLKNHVKAGGESYIFAAIASTISNNADEKLLEIGNEMMPYITVAKVIGDSCMGYLSGEIDADEFSAQIVSKTVTMVSAKVGKIVGSAIMPVGGAVVGSMIASAVSAYIIDGLNGVIMLGKLTEKELKFVTDFANVIRNEMVYHRLLLEELFGADYDNFKTVSDDAYELIMTGLVENNYQTTVYGLERLMSLCNSETNLIFSNINEADEWIKNDERKIRL